MSLHRLSHGVEAVVTSADRLDDLTAAVQAVLRGGGYISRTAAPIVLAACREAPGDGRRLSAQPLTARERDVVRELVSGHTIGAASRHLGIAVKTVEAHRARAFLKLGVANQNEAVARVVEAPGLLSPPER